MLQHCFFLENPFKEGEMTDCEPGIGATTDTTAKAKTTKWVYVKPKLKEHDRKTNPSVSSHLHTLCDVSLLVSDRPRTE
uniref:Uncharacterized protein n=1 Tax=Steinernema glaseri TaxID=37863 RepID=A0A1I8ANI0_9BILA